MTATRAARPIRLAAALVLSLGALVACSGEKEEPYVERPVEELYNNAVNAMSTGSYKRAGKLFDEVERQHPYSVWATRALLQAAYAHYQDNKYDDAIVALDRFIQLNPSNRDVGYAYYLKALCNYEQITDVARDARMTELSLQALQEVVRRFPETTFARDARVKIDLTYDHLAGKEMEVGRFYLQRGQWLAAINRFRTVVDKYQTTSHVPEALHRLVEGYMALGLVDEARRSAAVLGHNYPGSEWYRDSFALVGTGTNPKDDSPGLVSRTLNALNPMNLF
ncbi:MAG: outer membrane protein assembly factor BamD [Proteobacteria bacterium]|nr:outer membrane protein assembly factor BamD [Pseudomonadota bacterium]